ncbi:hypothetical protein CYMTET_52894 [Cymbomonas tetramitiformis]|uniref:Serine racemase n=1 Tax=Cymbomonas tetramitiformis TaxID=36881 RepID=A0AAE0ES99_9CHLO|nr:hypothetical protein CYMTET_52894 [Cymbomonas tetramitiformis]
MALLRRLLLKFPSEVRCGPCLKYSTAAGEYGASLESIQEAATRIRPYANRTPVMTSDYLNDLSSRNLFFKCEIFQKGGAFKFRGGCNAVFSLSEETAAKGVVTHSSGNHAGALALAANMRKIPAFIVIPEGAPQCKLDAVTENGGKITQCFPSVPEREKTAAIIQEKTGATMIPPYNYGPVISGQGTMALEFLEQVAELDAIVVPVSGGGMLSGIAIAAKALKPAIKVIAAEPSGKNEAPDVALSKARGELVDLPVPDTIADGLRAKLGSLTWPIIRDHVDDVVIVKEEEIIVAMKLIFERMKVVVEPSGAVGLAAVLSNQFQVCEDLKACKNVGIILCGGNLDLEPLFQTYK